MATIQLSFALRVSSGVKSVHLLGSWDNYNGQIPLSKDKSSSKSGSWKGTFRFQGNLEAGQRYWYYYIIDGYHVAHNPSEASTVEPTTGRELNILDVPKDKSSKSSSKSHSSSKSSSKHSSSSSREKHRSSKRSSTSDIPKGRPLSVSQIVAPKPRSPHATRHILDADYCDQESIEELTARFGSTGFDEEDIITDFAISPISSTGSSNLSYRSDSSSPSSSLSGYSTPASDCSNCTCERYGITRKGDRVKIDCGGARCGGYSDSDCSSGEEEEEECYVPHNSRRNGIVVRA
ncbi:uncharacterized protein GGS25DRAFT_364082 [Hypoxylon fragiforme]|uniref:uncharacterized protein n=1 Tax=Hypoxylon fragiforme TaxID=63214 RepID=UPI0020C68E20|nr:uncharacterized protein GGS25DRAFT_364082 [Hypoxylon fragiforme]KAI2605949.1 hypothetical protein GGS25DRAFT_364082 [Hypoxylon fragiforme]